MSLKKNIILIIFLVLAFRSFSVGISTLIIKEKKSNYDIDVKLPYLIGDTKVDRTNKVIMDRLKELEIQIEKDSKKNFRELTDSKEPKVTLKGEYTVRVSDSKMVILIVKNRYFLDGYDVQIKNYSYTLSPLDGVFYSREDIFINPSDGVYQVKKIIENEIRKKVRQTKTGESVNIYLDDIKIDMDYGGFYLEGDDLVVEVVVKGAPPYYDGWKKFKIPLEQLKDFIRYELKNNIQNSSSRNIKLNQQWFSEYNQLRI
ncbi:hypothetical protein [uncultured Ilyobacter sp.]|uniref:hypothetical protein n=1 Tax=uncultured Ilyobacter sp. TaxID=544433 RepID=UPI0029F55343|nr:hypothetical protein [uncultured Ilyobacter sp.]